MYGNSIPNTPLNPSDSFSSKSHQYQNHPKWQEFVDYCHSQGGEPTKKGFRTWLSKQTPYWRDKVRQKPGDEKGWELNGKFYPADEAIRMAEKNSELSLKFRKAIKRDGKIQIVSKNTLSEQSDAAPPVLQVTLQDHPDGGTQFFVVSRT